MKIGNDADFPFQPIPRTPVFDAAVQIAGSITVGALDGVDVPGVGPSPALLFRFTGPDGNLYTSTLLVLDDDQIEKLPGLVADACRFALAAAKARR